MHSIIDFLQKSRPLLISELKDTIRKYQFDYKTFGTAIEPYMIDIVISKLMNAGLITSSDDYKATDNKNEFPDLTIYISSNEKIAIEIKSGNHSKKDGDKWGIARNSENDMGTLNQWLKKIEDFGGENIYYLFIEYNFNDSLEEIVDIKIENFYKFIGINGGGVLKYREKDGNLRPKDFNAVPLINNLDEFMELFHKTEVYRSKNIIKKHINNIPDEERNDFLKSFMN